MRRTHVRRSATALALALVLSVAGLSGLPDPALAATATSADQLACDLSPTANSGYMTWWQAIPTNTQYQTWFWTDIVPNQTSACRTDVANTLWNTAAPNNWVSVPNLGGWPWNSGGYFAQYLWLVAIPTGVAPVPDIGGWYAPTGGYYAQTFWLKAVPLNWAPKANVGGWPWPSGGYYTQWLWLHAIPDEWADVANIGGWAWDDGGYYAQFFWLHAVPAGIDPIGNIGGWNAGTGGYYAQWLWLFAVPNNWAMRSRLFDNWPWSSGGYYTQWLWVLWVPQGWAPVPDIGGWNAPTGGYYQQFFWVHAVPDGLDPIANIGGWQSSTGGYYTQYLWLQAIPNNWSSMKALTSWPWGTGGYYTQAFWLRVVPDGVAPSTAAPTGYYDNMLWTTAAPKQWLKNSSYHVGGSASAGYYYYWLYRFSTAEGIAPRPTATINGDASVGYYAASFQNTHKTDAAIAPLWTLAHGYLDNAATPRPVNEWYKPDAQAVVMFAFDSEGSQAESCALANVFKKHKVTAVSFMTTGFSVADLATCISPYDVQNHTLDHPPVDNEEWGAPSLMDTQSDSYQSNQITANTTKLRQYVPTASSNAFRTPWCDSAKSFDNEVLHNALAAGMKSDSSVPVFFDSTTAQGVPVPNWYRNFGAPGPWPFIARTENGKNIVEFPFAYPSDYMAAFDGLDENHGDPTGTLANHAVNVWKNVFDQIYAQHGTMVFVMHPWLQVDDTTNQATAVDDLLTYMQAKTGVYFSTFTEARSKLASAYGW